MDAKGRCDIAPVPWHILKPYLSVIVLECVDDDPAVSFGVLCRQLERSGRQRAGKRSEVIGAS